MQLLREKINVRVLAICISLLLSIWLIWSDGVINDDGVLYMQSAQAFLEGDWAKGVRVYDWPLYSWLIACMHQYSGIGLENAGYVINSFFFALLVYVFIKLVDELNPKSNLEAWAALSILLLPSLNAYRAFVIRDAGYWALYLSALLFFLKYLHGSRLRHALGWGLAIAGATLFRIEGIVIMLFLPFALLADGKQKWRLRWQRFFIAQAILLMSALAMLLYALTHSATFSVGRLMEPLNWAARFLRELNVGIGEKADALQAAVLSKFTEDLAVPTVIAILVLIIVKHLISSLGILHLISVGYAFLKRQISLTPMSLKTIWWVITLQLIIAVVSATSLFFLTGRYLIPLALTLGLFAPFGLAHMHRLWQQKHHTDSQVSRNWLYPVVCLLILGAAVDSVFSFGPSHKYVKEGGLWIEGNTPKDARLLTNSEIASYYAQRPLLQSRGQFDSKTMRFLLDSENNYDYVAIDIGRKKSEEAALWSARFGKPVAGFQDSKGGQLLIFKNSKATQSAP